MPDFWRCFLPNECVGNFRCGRRLDDHRAVPYEDKVGGRAWMRRARMERNYCIYLRISLSRVLVFAWWSCLYSLRWKWKSKRRLFSMVVQDSRIRKMTSTIAIVILTYTENKFLARAEYPIARGNSKDALAKLIVARSCSCMHACVHMSAYMLHSLGVSTTNVNNATWIDHVVALFANLAETSNIS